MSARSLLRDLATIGLAIGAPLTLISGIFVVLTLIGGTPAFLWGLFLLALSLTVMSGLLFAYVESAAQRPTSSD